jgi:hypothetical protein
MKRKLIEYDAFNKIKTESLSNAQKELEAASNLLAVALEMEGLSLDSFGPNEVLFESLDGDFVHANYEIKNGYVQFDNVEQLVINEESEAAKSKEVISRMIDSLIESDEAKANEIFAEWMNLPRTKRIFTETKKLRVVPIRKRVGGKTKIVGYRKARWSVTPHSHESGSKTAKRMRMKRASQRKMPLGLKKFLAARRDRVKKTIGEWNVIAENVLNYLDLTQNGPVVDQCGVLRKENEIVSVRVPTMKLRNEAKLLKFNWDTMNTDVVVKRSNAKKMNENSEFVKEIAELKRANALSDTKSFEESLESISTKYADCIYLTEGELARQIKLCLESAAASNYDDETCQFLAEGIIRTIHENFVERVAKIVKLAGSKINEEAADKYAEFKAIAETYFKKLDESRMLEMQAFVDVYEALRQVHELAKEENNEIVAEEAAAQLDSLLPIVKGEAELSAEVLGEAAELLYDIVEGTMPEEWKVSEPVVSAEGEHPEVAKKGKTSQSPAEMQGRTPEAQHTSDGKECDGDAARELEGEGWSNLGGEGVYPELDNPYVLKAGEYKIANEKDIDSDSDQLAHWGDADTWPNLQNPYSKASVTPKSVKE